MPDSLSDNRLDQGQLFRRFVEGITDFALLMLDPDGTIVSWNIGAEKIKGYPADEVIGRHFSCLYTPEDIASGKPEQELRIAAETGRFADIGIRVRKDGSNFFANVIITPIRDESGTLIGFGEVTRDAAGRTGELAQLQRGEQAVRGGVERLRAVVDTAVDGIILVGADGTVLMFNPACVRLFGYDADEVIGKNVTMLMPPSFRGEYESYLANYHLSGEREVIGISREVAGRRKDGTTFPMGLSIGEATQDGETNFVGIIHDLTSHKRVNEQLVQAQKMESVGQLSGGIAHDFNNLLTVILGNADLLSDNLQARPDLNDFCRAILSAGERGAELTRRLLAFGRRQTLQPVAIDCNRQVEGMRQLLHRTLREDIDIRTSFDPTLKAAFADPAQLESAVLNLALNAQDAMPRGGRLTIATANAVLDENSDDNHPEVPLGDYVLVSVSDDGEGMPREVRERVFEPFFTTKEVGKGSGLGLSMIYGFAKQSNGHVSLYSEPGLGTTIRLYLPAAASAGKVVKLPPQTRRAQPMGRETVLVVEDDPFVRSFSVTCLKSLGYHVITAVDAEEALAQLREGAAPDVLFTDIVMPGTINGWELAEQARRIKPGIKILLTSGYALEALTARGRLQADVAVLAKPYRKSDLAVHLRQTLDAAA